MLYAGVLLCLVGYKSEAQVVAGSSATAAFNHIYNFNFGRADSIIQLEMPRAKDSAYWSLLSAYVSWSQILAGNLEDEYWNNRFHTDIRRAKQILKASDLTDSDRLFYYIIVHAFKTRHELLNDNYINAATDLNICVDQIAESFGRESEFEPLYLTSGLYYYFMQEAYDEYLLMRPYLLFYPDGDKDKGLRYLAKHTSSTDPFLFNESNYFLMRIYFDLEKDFEQALHYANTLTKANPNNPIYALYEYKISKEINPKAAQGLRETFEKKIGSMSRITQSQKTFFIAQLDE
ncbi:MAG: hypothetical protein Salg2KO_00980 [Salibacteraceae bacterium]